MVLPLHRVAANLADSAPWRRRSSRPRESRRYHDRAGGRFPVARRPDSGQGVGAPEEGVHEGSAVVPRRGVNHHAGGFFDDQQVGVFVQHTEGKILRHRVEGNGRRDDDGHRFPPLQAGRRTHDLSAAGRSLLDQPLPARPGDPGIASGRYRSRRSPARSAGTVSRWVPRGPSGITYPDLRGIRPAGLRRTSTSAWSK